MEEYYKMILDLLIRDDKENQKEEARPYIQIEIQDKHTTYLKNNQEDDEEKESSVIIIDI